jgi:glycosyltransferase involved in cell wall biosynthesis
MRKVLFVIPDLHYSGPAKQLGLVALGLRAQQVQLAVCVLGEEGALGPVLRSEGIMVEALGWRRTVSLGALVCLRRWQVRFRPDVIHAWRPEAVRALTVAAGRTPRSLVVSHALRPRQGGAALGRLDCWLLGRACRLVASGPDEARRLRQLGLAEPRVRMIPPGTALPRLWPAASGAAACPRPRRYILCAGPLEPHKGFRDAIWAFDVLRRLYSDLHLVLVGAGSERPRLEQFVQAIRMGQQVHFMGDPPDLATLLARAEVIWVPSRAEGGFNVALEAMAAARPVVASRLPGLAEIVADGQTGLLVPAGDKAALARQTRLVLDDPVRGRGLGEAGRQRVRQHFAAADLVRRHAELYEELLN